MVQWGWLQWFAVQRLALLIVTWFASVSIALAQLPGDTNCDGTSSPGDLLALQRILFGAPLLPCGFADENLDGRITAADVSALVQRVTAPPPLGPEVTYFGLASADGTPLQSSGTLAGAVVYQRPAGQGFKLVLEARPGAGGVSVGQTIFASDPRDPSIRPDVWIVVSQPLGDGSPAVCDGGVPAVHPPDFRALRRISDAINDLTCNLAVATSPAFSCTSDRFGRPAFVDDTTQVQFCLQVTRQLIFSDGETLVTAVVRDRAGNLGPLVQMRLRVGPGPFDATASPTATPTITPVRPTPSPTRIPSFTPTRTVAATATPTSSATPSRSLTASPTFTRPGTVATSPPVAPTATPSSPVPSPSTGPPTTPPTSIRSPSATSSRTATWTPSPTSTRSATATRTVSTTASPTPTVSRTRTPTRSPTAPPGPVIRFFGLTRSDDSILEPSGLSPDGVPIFTRPQGFGFSIVVEAARGPSGNEVGTDTFIPSLTALPDLQIVASRALGDGSDAVCDSSGPNAGGVPPLDPPNFLPTEAAIRVMNDFGCRFVDGAGSPRGRGSQEACTRVPPEMDFRFVASDSSVQFCAAVTRVLEFPPGDTVLTARVLDQTSADAPPGSGVPGPTARIIVRIGTPVSPAPSPSTTVTPPRTSVASSTPTRSIASASATPSTVATSGSVSPTRTRTRTPTATRTVAPSPTQTQASAGPVVTFFGLARADGTLLDATGTNEQGVPVYVRPVGAGFFVVVEAKPGPGGAPVGLTTFQPDLSSLPDLQVVASQSLGNGSADVCDARGPNAGGVPGVDPPRFDDVGVVNDLACRFRDGGDEPRGRAQSDACVLFENGGFGFVQPDTTVQFCAFVDRAWEFSPGDTMLTVRVRDTNATVSAVAQMIVRVSP
ncbi:MAG: hypothetical protein KatS3mg077_1422 [Candidatus Binatia bacterium]|nr:MAG: hypothetical protein KatS3mg077_1422 [Candidatus Binatia bacterium]